MKKKLIFFVLFKFICLTILTAQRYSLNAYLVDANSRQPIHNAHAFLVNTTFGTVASRTGLIELSIPNKITEDLIISHISYDTKLLFHPEYSKLSEGDTIWLTPNNFDVTEIVVSAKRSNKWKKRYKQFKRVFLGQDKAASKCKILNPEVLRFEEKDGHFSASAVDLIHIQNDFLGYEIHYLLTLLTATPDGSKSYSGKAIYNDLDDTPGKENWIKNREKTFYNSPKFFFRSLLFNQVVEEGFEMEIVQLNQNIFYSLSIPTRSDLLRKSVNGKGYELHFTDFLKIVNKNNREISIENVGLSAMGIESQKFSGSIKEEKSKVEYATSYLYKIAPFIHLNEFGNVLNTKKVKEYGFWAEQRMAHQLPFDYGNDYSLDLTIPSFSLNPTTTESTASKKRQVSDNQKLRLFNSLIYENNPSIRTKILAQVEELWEPAFIPVLIDFLRLNTDQNFKAGIVDLLEKKTKQNFGHDPLKWLEWLWQSPAEYGAYYADFKAAYYQHIDPKFKKYFQQQQGTESIRLDEIVWGGVRQDGIPPLRSPKLVAANEASYLKGDNVVFGVYLNGIAKAYPKRILAWHEFFTDTFGQDKVAGVYCTLCGTVIAYNMNHQGVFHDLGTSGFLYRSNKLMYDKSTQSLWNTIEGKPVLGPLAKSNISLSTFPVVTTTWSAWKNQHPNTLVLALDTGYDRDYAEGAAYANYFSNDHLMFPVPKLDQRLPNKAEVLIIRAPNYRVDPLAISINYLRKQKWYVGKTAQTNVVVLADKTGAARAFETRNIIFKNYKKGQLIDSQNNAWKLDGNTLKSIDNQTLSQISSHNIFWFAWFNSYPNTRLVK